MANIKSFPNNQDEYIGAEYVMKWLHGRTSGVFGANGNAAVTAVTDAMAVTVSDGVGWISNDAADGVVWWINEEAETGSKLRLSVAMADAVLPRIDRVVVSWQTTNYVALPTVTILKGTPASSPVAPALTNNNVLRQISLAAIRIPAGSTAISAAMISDERLNESVCGLVTSGVEVDTSVMQAQWEEFFAGIQGDLNMPVPTVSGAGKPVVVNAAGNGFEVGEWGSDDAVKSYRVYLQKTKWTGTSAPYTQTMSVPGVTADWVPGVPVIDPGENDMETLMNEQKALACLSQIVSAKDTLTFICYEKKPDNWMTIRIPGVVV